jgi:exosortase A-associated hydrolase 2
VTTAAHGGPFEAFYLPASHGERFCIFHPAAGSPRGTIVYLHPFAEEMNKSRRMAALQSRMFAARGFAVLQIDLFGCGDSSGEFGDARWEIWKHDTELALKWIRPRCSGTIHLWGLRLGALLALDFAKNREVAFDGFVLWQPVVSGELFVTQFLRLRVATEMIADGAIRTSTQELRNELNSGIALEIAGYDLAPELVGAIERLRLIELAPRGIPVHWFEIAPEGGGALSPASRRVAEAWLGDGVEVSVCTVAGEPFWQTIEIAECPALLEETTRAVAETQ